MCSRIYTYPVYLDMVIFYIVDIFFGKTLAVETKKIIPP
jgi:hypothetical protein